MVGSEQVPGAHAQMEVTGGDHATIIARRSLRVNRTEEPEVDPDRLTFTSSRWQPAGE